jgi:hypothetical protein
LFSLNFDRSCYFLLASLFAWTRGKEVVAAALGGSALGFPGKPSGWGLKAGGGSMMVVEDDVRESTHASRVLKEEDAKERTGTRWAATSFFLHCFFMLYFPIFLLAEFLE